MLGQNIGRVGLPDMASGGRPSLSFFFAATPKLDERITFTRASSATYFNETGTLQTATTNVPRFDYNPSTLAAQGLLIEESRTNSIRNNTMQGAVAGTPGTLPTNWQSYGTQNGITQTIVGIGSENGIDYIDIRYAGTATAAINGGSFFNPEQNTQIVAASGQSWTNTFYIRVVGGSTLNIILQNNIDERTAIGGFLTSSSVVVSPTSAALSSQRSTITRLLSDVSTARVTGRLTIIVSAGAAIDITLRIGLPQLEQGAFATSVIPTTTTALTRSADVASVNTLSPWFNSASGTLYVEASGVATNTGGTGSLFSFDDGTTNNRLITFMAANGTQPSLRVVSGGVDQANFAAGTISLGTTFKLAGAYAANDFAATVNNGSVATDTSGTVPAGQTTARLGTNVVGAASLNGYLRRITYYPRRLSNVDLQAITA